MTTAKPRLANIGSVPHQEVLSSIKLVGEQVIPKFSNLATSAGSAGSAGSGRS